MNKMHLLAKSGVLLITLYAIYRVSFLAKVDFLLVRHDFDGIFSCVSAGLLLACAIIVLFNSDWLAHLLVDKSNEATFSTNPLLHYAAFRVVCFFVGIIVTASSLTALQFIYEYYFGTRESLSPTAAELINLFQLGFGIYLLFGANNFVSWQIGKTQRFFADNSNHSKETHYE